MYIPEIPNNSLTEEITQIVELSKLFDDEYDFEYSPPSTEDEMNEWEDKHNIMIPESIKDWLRFSSFSNIRSESAIIRNVSEFKIGCEVVPDDMIIIGEVIGDGEFIGFSSKTGKILWEDHGKIKEYNSFKDILNRIINII